MCFELCLAAFGPYSSECWPLGLHAYMVSIETTFALVLDSSNKKMSVPGDCLKDIGGNLYFQLKCQKYSLVRLLCQEDSKLPKNPSIRNSAGVQEIMKKRNQLCSLVPSSSAMFDEQEQQQKTSKKRKLPSEEGGQDVLVDLGEYGQLWVRPAQMVREDISVPFQPEQLGILFNFLIHKGICVSGSEDSRHYQKSGKFMKKLPAE